MQQTQPLSSLAPAYVTPAPSYRRAVQPLPQITPNRAAIAHSSGVEKCDDTTVKAYSWGWLGALILWFVVFTVLFWLIFYSLKPAFVLQNNSNQVDTAKVLLAAVIASLILVVIIWLIKAAISRRY